MDALKRFIKTAVLGGFSVILPIALSFFFLEWLFNFLLRLIEPLTRLMLENTKTQKYFADILVVISILVICFFIGLLVKTRAGELLYETLENRILRNIPGYGLFKETIKQFLDHKRKPFSAVALVQVFENNTLMTGFVTDEGGNEADDLDGYCTVYVPSGLNPTTGLIYHLKKRYVHPLDIPVEKAWRSIISCGGGSGELLEQFRRKITEEKIEKQS